MYTVDTQIIVLINTRLEFYSYGIIFLIPDMVYIMLEAMHAHTDSVGYCIITKMQSDHLVRAGTWANWTSASVPICIR